LKVSSDTGLSVCSNSSASKISPPAPQKNLAASWRDTKTNVLAVYARNDYLSSEGDHRLIADIANRVRPGSGTFVALDGVDHGFQKTASPEDSFRRRDQPLDDFDPRVVATLKAWVDRVRSGR